MTLIEFLHPIRGGRRWEQALAVLYWFKHFGGQDEVSTSDVRGALARARISQARRINVTEALNQAAPFADRVGPRGIWTITGSGEDHVVSLGLEPAEPEAKHDVRSLQSLVASVQDEAVRGYITEGVECLQVDALRAAVVFIWTGAVATIRAELLHHGAPKVDAALKKHDPRARDFKKADDFENVKDSLLLEVAHTLGVFDKSEKKRLKEALDLRNDCGHPVKYKPGEKKVSGFVEDVLTVVFT